MAIDRDKLELINASTKKEFQLIETAQFYKVGNEVVVGDLYQDPTNPEMSIIFVRRRTNLKDIDSVVPTVPHNRRLEDKLEEDLQEINVNVSKL